MLRHEISGSLYWVSAAGGGQRDSEASDLLGHVLALVQGSHR